MYSIELIFVLFNCSDNDCFHRVEEYIYQFSTGKIYCKTCLSHYFIDRTYSDDLEYYTTNSGCHGIMTKVSLIIQKYCRNCLEVLCYKQIL
jgi:hypothetical protein